MKLYTLNYDCNRPTPQQINVPTNTDYKLGIKVMRNGKCQNLKPAEVTIGTLSADNVLVNGYLTFTGKTMDDPSMKIETINIEHGYDDAELIDNIIVNDTGVTISNPDIISAVTAEELGLTGKTVNAEDFLIFAYTGSAAEMPSETEMKNSLVNTWELPDRGWASLFQNKMVISSDDGSGIQILGNATRRDKLEYAKEQGLWKESDGVVFFYYKPGAAWYELKKTYTFTGNETIYLGQLRQIVNGNAVACFIQMSFGEPFDQKFKLTTNVFKSQQGDLAVASSSGTVTLEGEFADGTEFSYDLLKA